MLKRLLLSNSSLYFFALPVLAIIVVYFTLTNSQLTYNESLAIIKIKPLFYSFNNHVSANIFWSLVSIIAALFIPMLSSRFGMFEFGVFQTSIFWISLVSCYIYFSGEFQPLLAAIMTLPLYYFLFGMYKSEFSSHLLFNASILTSVASLFYLPAIFSLGLIWIGWLLYNPFNFRTFIMSLIGSALPFLFSVSYYYMTDDINHIYSIFDIKISDSFSQVSFKWHLFIGITALFTFAGILRLFLHGFVKKIGIRKNFTLLILSLLLYIGLYIIFKDIAFIAFTLFPATMLINLHFTNINRTRIYEILFLIFIGLLFFIPYLPESF